MPLFKTKVNTTYTQTQKISKAFSKDFRERKFNKLQARDCIFSMFWYSFICLTVLPLKNEGWENNVLEKQFTWEMKILQKNDLNLFLPLPFFGPEGDNGSRPFRKARQKVGINSKVFSVLIYSEGVLLYTNIHFSSETTLIAKT